MAYRYWYKTYPNFAASSTSNRERNTAMGYINPDKTHDLGLGLIHNADNWKNLSFSYGDNYMTRDWFLGTTGSDIVNDSTSGFIATARIKQDTLDADIYSVNRRHLTSGGNLYHRYDTTFTINGTTTTYTDPCPDNVNTDIVHAYLIASYVETYSSTFPAVRYVTATDNGIYYIGPVITSNIIKAILGEIEDEDTPEAPEDNNYPVKDVPENAWTGTVEGWENEFGIMAIPEDPVESQYWWKNCVTSYATLRENLSDMEIFDGYGIDNAYTGTSQAGSEFVTSVRAGLHNINTLQAALGTSLIQYNVTDDKKRFVIGSPQDDAPYSSYTQFNLNNVHSFTVKKDAGTLKFDYNNSYLEQARPTNITITYTPVSGSTETYTCSLPWAPEGNINFPNQLCIAKMTDDNFYLVGYNGISYGSFGGDGYSSAVFCIIDKIPIDGLLDMFPYDVSGSEPNPDSETITEDILDEMGLNPISDDTEYNEHDGDFGEGTGDPFKDDEEIDDPYDDLPESSESYGAIGMFEVYAPTVAQLNDFGTELNSDSVLNILKDYFTTNPMDGIMGLYMLPYSGVAGTTTKQPCIGTHSFNTALNLADEDFLSVDYGSLYVECIYDDSWLDFAPNTDVKIYLPFIGYKEIDIGAIMNCDISLKYNVNVLTGDILAYLYSKNKTANGDGKNHLIYQWQGNCAFRLPLTHTDYSSAVSAGISAVSGIATGVAGIASGSAGMAVGGMVSGLSNASQGFRPKISTSGNITGSAGFMGSRTPYLMFSRPILVKKTGDDDTQSNYKHEYGKPLGTTYYVSDVSGYTVIRNLDTSGVKGTDEEREEIKNLFESGVWV